MAMVGGPLFPHSSVPRTAGKVFPAIHQGAGSNGHNEEGLGVMASLDEDAIWDLTFRMPPTLPGGVGKLRLRFIANASAGVIKVNPTWASIAKGEDASDATLTAEGVETVTWGSGDEDAYKEVVVILDGDTLVAKEEVVMALTFVTSGWTLAQTVTCIPSIFWE